MSLSTRAKYCAKCRRLHKFLTSGANSSRQVQQVSKHVSNKTVECRNIVGIMGAGRGTGEGEEDRKEVREELSLDLRADGCKVHQANKQSKEEK